MNFLILYGTTEGQTRKIANFVGEQLTRLGHIATLQDATDSEAGYIKLREFDGVIVAASLHLGFYQAAVEEFVRNHHDTLNGMRTAFLSVSLAAASKDPEDRAGMEKCVERFLTATSWKPGEIHHVIGAFRYTQYDFFKRWGMKLIAREKGIETGQDLELTDWIQLTSSIEGFVRTVMKAKGAI